MSVNSYNHYRHGHHPFTWGFACTAAESATLKALPEAIQLVEQAIYSGRLLTPVEAMALAGREAREKDTLYSIALRICNEQNLELDTLLKSLCQRFPGYA